MGKKRKKKKKKISWARWQKKKKPDLMAIVCDVTINTDELGIISFLEKLKKKVCHFQFLLLENTIFYFHNTV